MSAFATSMAAAGVPETMVWKRRRGLLSRTQELRSGERVVAVIRSTGFFYPRVEAEFEGRRWRLADRGIALGTCVVRDAVSEDEVGRFSAGFWRGGVLELRSGSLYRWRRLRSFAIQYAFTRDAGDDPLVTFRSHAFRAGGEIGVHAEARRLPELPLLVVVGWALMLGGRGHRAI